MAGSTAGSTIKRERKFRLGSVEMGVAIDAAQAEKLRSNPLYRHVLRPALGRLSGRSNGHKSGETAAASRFATLGAAPATPEARALIDRIADIDWYHVIDLPHGVSTPGFVDHRDQIHMYGLPEDMSGMRVLEVATWDGFWSFEMERRGAEVVCIDIPSMKDVDMPRNWPDKLDQAGLEGETGKGFKRAAEILGSRVQRELLSVYELNADKLGMFDMAFCSDLLLHLRDPLMAMENIWRVVKDFAIIADVYNPDLEGINRPMTEFTVGQTRDLWWLPNSTCLVQMLQVARFSRIEEVSRFRLNASIEMPINKVVFKAFK